jgi:lysophospholipase L1-like esterase
MTFHRLRPARLLGLLVVATACVHEAPAPAPRAATTTVGPAPVPATASAFEPEIAAFEARDRVAPPPRGGIVFVGSSSIRFWPNLASDFPDAPVVNRGFGGSTLADVIYFAPRIVLPYAPRMIVLYAGDNDLAAGRTPEQVLGDYTSFVRLVRRALPATRLVYMSIKPSPSRWALAEPMRAANALIAQAIARDTLATFVDVFTPMLDASGRPRPALFQADSLHMTPAGYVLWRARLAPLVH